VGDLRARHDPSGAFAVPAHITLLGPFLLVAELSAGVLERLRALLAGEAPVAVAFREARRFPGTLYLAPEPPEPFARLTQLLWDAWPDHPPYGGIHEEVVPHLTVGHHLGEDELPGLEAELATRLPVETVLDHAVLLAYDREALEAIWAGRPAPRSAAQPVARLPFGG
jgi:2'-5' RNA ligase